MVSKDRQVSVPRTTERKESQRKQLNKLVIPSSSNSSKVMVPSVESNSQEQQDAASSQAKSIAASQKVIENQL